MKRRTMVLVAVNIILALLLTLGPLAAQIFPKSVLRDCCVNGECRHDYCWVTNDCGPGVGDCD